MQHAPKHVKTFVGRQFATVPCGFHDYNRTNSKVVVSRDDLNPKYVHIQEQGYDRYYTQNKLFEGRTSWSYQTGDLFLREPQIHDSGTYTCILRDRLSVVNKTLIKLDVKETFGHKFSDSMGFFLLSCVVGLLFLMAAFGAFRRWKKTRAAVASVCKMIVSAGEPDVKLPFQIRTWLKPGDIVEWLCLGPELKVVQSHVVGANRQKIPHKSYNGCAWMAKQTDLSLTVSAPRRGTYTCTVYRERQTHFQEQVKVQAWDMMRKEIRLSCTTAPPVSEGDIVEWKFSHPEPKVVYQHVIGRDEPEYQQQSHLPMTDLTLTLSPPRSGIYTCTVRRGGDTLDQTVMEVLVKEQSCFQEAEDHRPEKLMVLEEEKMDD